MAWAGVPLKGQTGTSIGHLMAGAFETITRRCQYLRLLMTRASSNAHQLENLQPNDEAMGYELANDCHRQHRRHSPRHQATMRSKCSLISPIHKISSAESLSLIYRKTRSSGHLNGRRTRYLGPRPIRSMGYASRSSCTPAATLLLFAPSAPVAQLDRVPGFEPGGREFESLRARQ